MPEFNTTAGRPARWFPLDRRSQIEITGNDRAKFLHNFCTQEIKNLAPGKSCEAFITSVKGRILGHIFVFATENSLWIDTVPDQESPLIAHLDKYLISEDVTFHPRTVEWSEIYLTGVITSTLQKDEHHATQWQGIDVVVRRVDWFGEPGLLLDVAVADASKFRESLESQGIARGTPDEFEARRIHAGLPHYGIDLTEENLAQEAGRTATAISFKKGCYLGQEPIARIDALGHVNRELRSLEIDTKNVPPTGTPVLSEPDGKEIGRITSSAYSAEDQKTYALAILQSRFTSPGTTVRVATADGPMAKVFWLADC
ncbi:MAG: YgfZ/GcvT domain-containing protein [Planctomycetaceae bacterium]